MAAKRDGIDKPPTVVITLRQGTKKLGPSSPLSETDGVTIGCARDGVTPDIVLDKESRFLSREALVLVGGPVGLQVLVQNRGGATLCRSRGDSVGYSSGDHVSVAEGDRLRLPGDDIGSEVAAFWVEFGFMNMPRPKERGV